ncbi:hypothetical protein [Glutamicibacter protophormiae]|uniref:hypothetical protein n=1 Tax=Glutamicibacter protophormiae TaxID=37930 RepID=UPI0019585967|nr:hypothetical protein [Glutamicibacter protophormiae]QRQ79539.1 hypothetical protein JQN66_04755 [Glutamicibacter protophormiae]
MKPLVGKLTKMLAVILAAVVIIVISVSTLISNAMEDLIAAVEDSSHHDPATMYKDDERKLANKIAKLPAVETSDSGKSDVNTTRIQIVLSTPYPSSGDLMAISSACTSHATLWGPFETRPVVCTVVSGSGESVDTYKWLLD